MLIIIILLFVVPLSRHQKCANEYSVDVNVSSDGNSPSEDLQNSRVYL